MASWVTHLMIAYSIACDESIKKYEFDFLEVDKNWICGGEKNEYI